MADVPKRNSWHLNFGPQLLSIGTLVAGLMCVLWYFQLLPDFDAYNPDSQISTDFRPTSAELVGRFELPKEGENSDAALGLLLIFAENSQIEFSSNPTFSFRVDLADKDAATVIVRIPIGTYSAIACLDQNNNGLLDFDADGNLAEPALLGTADGGKPFERGKLKENSFTISSSEPGFIHARFQNLNNSKIKAR